MPLAQIIIRTVSGELAERLNAPVLKTGRRDERLGGSNPPLSATLTLLSKTPREIDTISLKKKNHTFTTVEFVLSSIENLSL